MTTISPLRSQVSRTNACCRRKGIAPLYLGRYFDSNSSRSRAAISTSRGWSMPTTITQPKSSYPESKAQKTRRALRHRRVRKNLVSRQLPSETLLTETTFEGFDRDIFPKHLLLDDKTKDEVRDVSSESFHNLPFPAHDPPSLISGTSDN